MTNFQPVTPTMQWWLGTTPNSWIFIVITNLKTRFKTKCPSENRPTLEYTTRRKGKQIELSTSSTWWILPLPIYSTILFIYFSRSNNSLFSLKNNVKIMCFCYVFQEKVKIYFLLYIDKVKILLLKFEKREKLLSFYIYIWH